MGISLYHYLFLSAILFTLGVLGLTLNRSANIQSLMASFFMSIAVILNFVAYSYFMNDLTGQIFSILLLAISAAEIIVGLAIILHAKSQKKPEKRKAQNDKNI
ncbi:MAG: NADH-quinone oxidoreductase subunit NuoK [Alphaproteobacteria bacterium]